MGNIFSIGSTSKKSFQNYQPKIAELLNKFKEKNNLPALVFTIDADNNNRYHYKSGFIAIDSYSAIDNNSLFESSSITKTFVAILAFKLAGEGKIRLQDNLARYLPKYHKWKDITIKQLMNMTSGIYNFYANEDFRRCIFGREHIEYTPDMLINLAYEEDLKFSSGQQWHYSNTNYLILGKVLEKATGKDLNSLLYEYILHPFNLENTYYSETVYSSEIMAKKVHGYYNDLDVTYITPSNFGATGSMLINDEDLQKLIHFLFREQSMLTKEELKEMLNDVKIPDDGGRLPNSGYGGGIFITDDEKHGILLWNVGLGAGYSCSFVYIVKRNVIITLQINRLYGHDLKVINHNLLFPHGELLQQIMNLVTDAT